MPNESKQFAPIKPVKKTRLARYALDHFLLDVSQSVAPGALLLDGGAGNCKYRSFFPHARTIAFDLVPQRRRKYGEVELAGNLYDIPFKDDTFDVVINIEVLEHLQEPGQALVELFRVLRPGGRLFLVAPQGWEEHFLPHDYFRFTRFGLRYLFEKAGYKIVSIEPLGGFFWYLGHRISASYRYLFPAHRKQIWRIIDAPVRHPMRLLLRTIIPYLCFYLDRYDTVRTYTLNYGCICEKPAS
jgi:SAM-dependent methyltransferase